MIFQNMLPHFPPVVHSAHLLDATFLAGSRKIGLSAQRVVVLYSEVVFADSFIFYLDLAWKQLRSHLLNDTTVLGAYLSQSGSLTSAPASWFHPFHSTRLWEEF